MNHNRKPPRMCPNNHPFIYRGGNPYCSSCATPLTSFYPVYANTVFYEDDFHDSGISHTADAQPDMSSADGGNWDSGANSGFDSGSSSNSSGFDSGGSNFGGGDSGGGSW